jgi:hypothetical protein
MLAGTDPETPLDRWRLSEFFAEPKNSHGARSVTGSSPKRWRPTMRLPDAADIGDCGLPR